MVIGTHTPLFTEVQTLVENFFRRPYNAPMNEAIQIKGRLVSLQWPKGSAEATLAFDTTQLQVAKAEIEDSAGVTHRVDVLVQWDSDYLIGKEVTANSTEEGTTLSEIN